MAKLWFRELWKQVVPIRYARIVVTTAEVLALNTTSKALVAAQGAGRIVEFVSAVFFLNYNSATYAANGIVTVKTTGGTALSAPIAAGDLVQKTVDAYRVAAALSTNDIALVSNEGLELTCDSGDPTTGDSEIVINVAYRIHDFS